MPMYSQTSVKGWHIPARGRSTKTDVPALAAGRHRFPVVDTVFRTAEHLPTMKAKITVSEGRRQHFFEIYFQYSATVGRSAAARRVWNGAEWRGDILVLMTGSRVDYVNISTWKDLWLARKAVEAFLMSAHRRIEDAIETGFAAPIFPRELNTVVAEL